MAPTTRTRPVVDLDIHDEYVLRRDFNPSPPIEAPSSVLGELHLGNIQNIKPTVDALATELGNFHIDSTTKENLYEQHSQPPTRTRGYKPRPQVEPSTFQLPLANQDSECTPPVDGICAPVASAVSHDSEDSLPEGALESAARELPSNTEQLLKHHAGQFEWLLTVPAHTNDDHDSTRSSRPLGDVMRGETESPHAEEKRVLFGCNLVRRKTPIKEAVGDSQNSPANIYTLLATRIEVDDDCSSKAATIATVDEVSILSSAEPNSTIIRMDSPQAEAAAVRRTSGSALSSRKDDIADQILALPPANPSSRIEDSVEALDKLEEELEALNEVARLDRVLSPEESKSAAVVHSIDTSLKRTGSVAKKPASGTVRVRTSAERSSSVRKSVSSAVSQDDEKSTTANRGPRKSLVSRPASLLPPKPPARSSKPPTVSTFELPGEAVARRLKEQREARLSRQFHPEQAAAVAATFSPSKPHAKSTKAPTRPTFELPGEAISRRKREEREAKLRAQEEEERKRREFKARPIRSSIAPNSYPRETIASRARQGKLSGSSEAEGTATVTLTPNTAARKRQSMAAGASAATPRMFLSTTRGRSELTVDSAAGTSRATSTSTGSTRGSGAGNGSVISVSKRSTVSTEDQVQQKARGREIFSRDNSIAAEREKERREREAAAKLARQEAAERSRQLSREWALKQKAKRASMMGSEECKNIV